MPAKASDLARVARKLGFEECDRRVAMPAGNIQMDDQLQFPCMVAEIGSWLFYEILKQLGITEEEFSQLR